MLTDALFPAELQFHIDRIEMEKDTLNDCRLEIGRFQKVKTESHSERLKPAESWSLAQAN